MRESFTTAKAVANVMAALQTEIAWVQICTARGDTAAATAYVKEARSLINDGMLPCARERFLEMLDQASTEREA